MRISFAIKCFESNAESENNKKSQKNEHSANGLLAAISKRDSIFCQAYQPNVRDGAYSGKKSRVYARDRKKNENNLACLSAAPDVFMQTLHVNMKSEKHEITIRAVFDSGSQHSYTTKNAAAKMRCTPLGEQRMDHLIFGGGRFRESHKKYKIRLPDLKDDYACNFSVLDQ